MNDRESNDLKYIFTAYVETALKRRKRDYMAALNTLREYERPLEEWREAEPQNESSLDDGLPLVEQLHNRCLVHALRGIDGIAYQVLCMRIVDGRSFEEISVSLGITYNMARNIYYRSVKKIRKEVLNDE